MLHELFDANAKMFYLGWISLMCFIMGAAALEVAAFSCRIYLFTQFS